MNSECCFAFYSAAGTVTDSNEYIYFFRIRLILDLPDVLIESARTHEDYIASQVLATEIEFADLTASPTATAATIDPFEARFDLSVV